MKAYDTLLREWPVAFEELDIPTRLGSTHVIASGSTDLPALILLPSFAASATVWRPNIAELSRHFRTYAVDVIGQPGKSVAIKRIQSRQEFADWLVELLDALHVERASLVGNSFGGFLAMNLASLAPERVERVVLISPAGIFAGLSWRFICTLLVLFPVRRWMHRLKSDKRAGNFAADVLRLSPCDLHWSAMMSVTMDESGPGNVINTTVFSDNELQAIRAPTLLLIGDRERMYEPHSTLQLALKRMPQLEGGIVKNAHHIAAMAQPDVVNERIIRFLFLTNISPFVNKDR